MDIEFRTGKSCIESAAKREYEKALKHYFREVDRREELEERIDGLKLFLESVDVKSLRNKFPRLDKGGDVTVLLRIDVDRKEIELVCQNRRLKPPLKEECQRQADGHAKRSEDTPA